MLDTLVAIDPVEPTSHGSIDDFGIEARAEFERLRIVLDLVDDPVPTRVDRYRIDRVIGRGGMGVVLHAQDPNLDRSVALKLVHAGPFVNRDRLHARLQREARVLARLSHPNVVTVHDVGTHEGELFLSMEYVSGTNLRAWQEARPHSTTEILEAYLQAARGLAAAHRAGIVHRDFKPDNALIDDDGRVRVVDFGLANDSDLDIEPDAVTGERDIGRTQTGALMGTLRYMAPERLAGKPATAASDQFEFCVSLWEALTGSRPFPGNARDELASSMTGAPLGGAKLDRRIRRVLERGLAPDPEQRFRDFDALIDALDQKNDHGRWLTVIGLTAILGLVIGRGIWAPEPEAGLPPCEVGDRIVALDDVTLALPEGSSDTAIEAVQARFDRMVGQLRDEANEICPRGESPELARLGSWVDTLEVVAEHSDEVSVTRTLDTLSELQFERDRQPPDLHDPEVARLLDEAREHIAMGRLDEAEKVTQRAAERAEEYSDRAEISLRLGQLAGWSGRPAAALEHYDHAIADADAAGRDHIRLAAHLLATPLALGAANEPDVAEDHHRRAVPLFERLELDPEDPARVDYEEHEASFAAESEKFDDALAIQQRVLARRISNGDPLPIAKARLELARIHHMRANVIAEPDEDERAGIAGYRQVLAELEALDVAPGHPLRLQALLNLGLLLFTPGATEGQLDEAWTCLNAVVEAGRSRYYMSAMQNLVGLLVEREGDVPSPSPDWLAEAERLGGLLQLELQAEDLSPQVRLETWAIVAYLHARRGDLAAAELADATILGLVQAEVDKRAMTTTESSILLAGHTMQLVKAFEFSNPELAHRYAKRAKQIVDRLPPESIENPDIASMVADIADAANASEAGTER